MIHALKRRKVGGETLKFFQALLKNRTKIMKDRPHWYLVSLVVKSKKRRNGTWKEKQENEKEMNGGKEREGRQD
jgi:hypothetical protein